MDGNDRSNIGVCPVMHAKAGVRSNSDWWPNQLNVKILYQNSSKSDPMNGDFKYSERV
jgi:Catalase (peroxidase I)